MSESLFSDGQAAALVSALLGGLGAIAGAIKWGLGRNAKAFDDMGASFKAMADEHRITKEVLIELRGEVREGREDIREIRDAVSGALESTGPVPVARRSRRVMTPPAGVRARTNDDRGSVAGMLLLVLAGAAVIWTAGMLWSCSSARQHARSTAGAAIDCALVAYEQHADDLEALVRDATNLDGSIDWTRIREAVKKLGWSAGGCALATVIAKLFATPAGARLAPAPDVSEVRAEWNLIRHEVLGGRSYLVAGRVL